MSISSKSDGDIITIGYDQGEIELVVNFNFDKRMSVKYHDGHNGQITGCSFNKDQSFFVTVAKDGLTNVHQFDKTATYEENAYDPLEGVEGVNFLPAEEKTALAAKRLKEFQTEKAAIFAPIDPKEQGLDEASLAITIKTKDPIGVDADPTKYSIQQSKLRTEEDHRLTLADRKKQKVRVQINDLREAFN